ncbi:hypothetical protein GCM10027061_23020 [Nesterenkonia suensis]
MYRSLQFDLSPDSIREALRIRVQGALTAQTTPQLITFLERRVHLPDCPELLVSLCGLEHIDPQSLDQVLCHIAAHNDEGAGPEITVDLPVSADAAAVPAHVTAARRRGDQQASNKLPPDRPRAGASVPVRSVLMPLHATISTTRSFQEAAERTPDHGCLVVLDLSDRPQGILRSERLQEARESEPEHWGRRRCAALTEPFAAEVPVDVVVQDPAGTAPVLVVDGEQAVGVVLPERVRP